MIIIILGSLKYSSLPSSMKSCNGLSKYTIEAFTVDDHNGHESRGEKEIILLVPNVDLMVGFNIIFAIKFNLFFINLC